MALYMTRYNPFSVEHPLKMRTTDNDYIHSIVDNWWYMYSLCCWWENSWVWLWAIYYQKLWKYWASLLCHWPDESIQDVFNKELVFDTMEELVDYLEKNKTDYNIELLWYLWNLNSDWRFYNPKCTHYHNTLLMNETS